MSKTLDWDSRVGRRLRLRDLHVLFAVVEHGSMSGAGAYLGMSQSAVSQAIAALEDALKVRLLDRTPRGVEPTLYADAIIRRGRIVFDELRSGIKDIDFLADPAGGEVRIACSDVLAGGILAPVVETFSKKYPRVVFEVLQSNAFGRDFVELRARKADLALAMLPRPLEESAGADLTIEHLFEEELCIAASARGRWGRRRKLGFADLADASWITAYSGAPAEKALFEAFRTHGLPPPRVVVKTVSAQLRNFLSRRGPFVALVPASFLKINAGMVGLKMLPLHLPMPPLPVVMITLRNRTLSRTVEQFLDCMRDVVRSIARSRGSIAR
ncbi:MAG TPA: LysR family transcriptional regulator [Xanthobacteraceae bacterium]|jgi:DNA-binding transcriptional LysR family regulator